jgi:hypothetical protein
MLKSFKCVVHFLVCLRFLKINIYENTTKYMKHLKKFKNYSLLEAIIIPDELIGDYPIIDIEDAKRFGDDNDFKVVDYDEFYNSLSEKNKKTAPPKWGIPFFAVFNPNIEKIMFVVCDENAFSFLDMKKIIGDIIPHEKIHSEQHKKRNKLIYNLPNPMLRKEYFSNKDEIMAFSWTIANGLFKSSNNIRDAVEKLNLKGYNNSEHMTIWRTIKSLCDEKIINRYKKNIYLYLEDMYK